ncbi:DUF2007 domain-containing protein [bacterium]|jgi:hypothetical protein|nr:DUF2007 domain-containing protein [Balneola sp.]MBR9917762.1 DUF2007 domain-containing protein [bacterium]
MFSDPKPNDIENWVCVLERSTKLEVELAKSYLSSLKIPSNILSKQDSSYSLSVGDMSFAYLYVPNEFEKVAREALEELDKANEEEGEDS